MTITSFKTNTPLRLFHFRRRNGMGNFGDDISPVIIERILGRRVISTGLDTCDLAGIGSLLEAVVRVQKWRIMKGNFRRIRVWGTGTIRNGGPLRAWNLKILSVRGERTANRLSPKAPRALALGDPGLLLSRFYSSEPTKTHSCCFIPHFIDAREPNFLRLIDSTKNAIVANVEGQWQDVVNAIRSSEIVISSSLHGLIAADALGVPSVWVRASPNVIGGDWKFTDYYSVYSSQPPSVVDISGNLTMSDLCDLATSRAETEVHQICDAMESSLLEEYA